MRKSTCLLLLLFVATNSFSWDKPQSWIQVKSPNFLVITNGSEKQGRHVADQFERMRSVFHTRFPSLQVDPAVPIVIIATKSEKDFREIEPADYLGKGQLRLAGYFLRAADKNYILVRLDTEGEHPFEIVYHEYTHLLTSKTGAWLPLWLNEGLAEFYQTTEIRDKEALLGEPSHGNLLLLRNSQLLPLSVLFAVDRSSPYYHEESKGSIFYAESWALTHYFMIMDQTKRTHLLSDYAELVSKDVDPVTAGSRVFGDLKKLQQTLENYVAQKAFTYFKMPAVTQVDESAFQAQPINPTQADAIRADLMAYTHRTADSRKLLEQVLQQDPANAPAHETMGFLNYHEGHLDEARKWYGQAVKLDSHSYLAHYYFAAMTVQEGSISAEEEPAVEASLRTAIKLNPGFAPSYDMLAAFYAMRKRNLDEAHILCLKAIQLDPGNLPYRMNAANILMAMGRGKDAVVVLQNAINLAKNPAEKARAESFLHEVERYELARQQAEQYQGSASQHEPNPNQKPIPAIPSDSETSAPPKLVRRPAVKANTPDSGQPALAIREEELRGPHNFATGSIKNVQCSGLSTMDFIVVVAAGHEIQMHSGDYYKIQFSALGFAPTADLQPCSQLEGRPAKVEYIEPSDKSIKDRIVAVELHK